MSGKKRTPGESPAPAGYWRSPAQLQGDPSALRFAQGEFPEGADQAPAGIGRRQMLTLMGAGLSMAWMAGCRRPEEAIVPYVVPPEEIIPGVPQHYATTMPFGHSAWGLVVEAHEGRPNKIEGNALHPSTRGASGALAQASIYGLYDPDRSTSILEQGEKRTWDQLVTAMTALRDGLLPTGGEGLAVLAEPCSSPTLARVAARFRERFPKARWVTWAPWSEENVDRGVEMAAGRPLVPVLHPGRAEVILALDADFLVGDPEAVRHAREFADGRRLATEKDTMNRLYAVESRMTPTGASADHRLRLQAGRMGAFVAALAARLGFPGAPSAAPPADVPEAWLAGLASDLAAARGRSLILAGEHLPPPVHGAVAALNAFLGNNGSTVTWHAPADTLRSRTGDLKQLAEALAGGQVKTLLVLGANPAYAAPADLGMAGALARAGTLIHLGPTRDETGEIARWHIPEAHYLESWGDARAAGGGLSVIQPLIAPLHGGRTAAELLALLEGGQPVSAYDLTRETWAGILAGSGFEAAWKQVLYDGYLPGSELKEETFEPPRQLPAGLTDEPASGERVELVFHPGAAVYDGRYANVAWLQELPDPVTKLTWDNAACLSPATARSLGVKTGDMIRLTAAGRSLEIAALEVPGQADRSISLALGYGRRAAGRVGNGVGFDTYALRGSASPWIAAADTVERAGGTYLLATTQDHWAIDTIGASGRDQRLPSVVRAASLEEYREHPGFARERFEHPELESIYPDHPYESSPQWGMTIDLATCTGCNACVIACQSENNIPVVGKEQVSNGREMHWIRVDRYYSGDPDNPDHLAFQPVTCQHCENAPCEQVCPVGATVHDQEGLNAMVYNRCIGTRYCSNNCSYKVRRFNYFNFTKDTPELLKMAANPDVTVRSRGVMEKCTFCTQRIQAAKIDARAQGHPLPANVPETACQQACPSRAISFGNIRDPQAEVVKLRASNRSYELLAELNNRPRVSYLAKIRNLRTEERS